MKRPIFHIVHSYRSGLGAELVRTSAVIRRMEAYFQIYITSFNWFIYDRRFKVNALSEIEAPRWVAGPNDTGICFDCGLRSNGPFAWRSLAEQAKSLGWLVLPEDIDPTEPQLYSAASRLADGLDPSGGNPSHVAVLSQGSCRAGHLVLNLFGGSAPDKGFIHRDAIFRLIGHLGQMLPEVAWIIPRLPHQWTDQAQNVAFGSNFQLVTYPYGSRELTELFHCRGVVTVEGGGLHIALEQGSPTLLLSSKSWLNNVANLLPPSNKYETVITDLSCVDQSRAAYCIAAWVKALEFSPANNPATKYPPPKPGASAPLIRYTNS
jgi:hypothetical protein